MSKDRSALLPIAYVFLRILLILNWVLFACIAALLTYTFVNEAWTMKALGVAYVSNTHAVLTGMRAIAAIGLVAILLNNPLLKRLLAMVETVRSGDPFVAENAYRLQAIAWLLLALQLLGMVADAVGKTISTSGHEFHLDAGFSLNGWLTVVLTFILARVFAEGTLMREDLEGMV